MPSLSQESLDNLAHVHPDMQRVAKRATTLFDFKVLCGLRSEAAQKQAILDKTSSTAYPDSKHNFSVNSDGTKNYQMSDAFDAIPFPIKWPDPRSQSTYEYAKRLGAFYFLAGVVLMAATIEGVKVRWGGHFKSFFDGPHFERVP